MTQIAIPGIAFSSDGEMYQTYHSPPEFKDYIESVTPNKVPHEYEKKGKYFIVETDEIMAGRGGCTVTAAPHIHLPNGESRDFSYWRIDDLWITATPTSSRSVKIYSRNIDISRGENGIIALYYGVRRPPVHWPGFNIKNFDLFMHIMQEHAPGYVIPDPQPWVRTDK